MNRKLRTIVGIAVLAISVALLIWAFLPVPHETRIRPIPPEDLQLPTPVSYQYDSAYLCSVSQLQPLLFRE